MISVQSHITCNFQSKLFIYLWLLSKIIYINFEKFAEIILTKGGFFSSFFNFKLVV